MLERGGGRERLWRRGWKCSCSLEVEALKSFPRQTATPHPLLEITLSLSQLSQASTVLQMAPSLPVLQRTSLLLPEDREAAMRWQAEFLNLIFCHLQNSLPPLHLSFQRTEGCLGPACVTCESVNPWHAECDMAKPLIPHDTICTEGDRNHRLEIPHVPQNAYPHSRTGDVDKQL